MKIKTKRNVLLIILLFGSLSTLFAQKSSVKDETSTKWFVGLNGGVTIFLGDVKFNSFWPDLQLGELQPGGSLVFGRKFSHAFKLSTELSYTSLKGIQEILPDTLEFKTQALSFALQGHYNIMNLFGKSKAKTALFLEGGAGIMAWQNLLENTYTNDTLNNLGWTNSDKQMSLFLPVGIKLEYQLSPRISTYFKSNYNFVFSDLLDGNTLGKNDHFIYNTLGINYNFGKQKTFPKLLPYNFVEIAYDSLALKSKKSETKPKDDDKIKEVVNPFSVKLEVPETAAHTGFDINIKITKLGIKSSGFFRLIVPSGFLPEASPNNDVSFTKLEYRYEYEFFLPLNQDTTNIPIHINLSEIEMGTFPLLVEGEIMSLNGPAFPIKFANYVKIISEDAWNQGLLNKEQEKKKPYQENKPSVEKTLPVAQQIKDVNTKSEPEKKELPKTESQKQTDLTQGIYRIQIMASRKPFADIENFKTAHSISDEIYIAQADGWFRYNIYAAPTREEAEILKEKVKTIHGMPQAFIVYYENGKRILNSENTASSQKTSSASKYDATQKQVAPHQNNAVQIQREETDLTDKLVYRIEFALGYDKPIPIYILQNKVGKEAISEFKINHDYYYTIGTFEELEVAKAYLKFVKSQFKLDAKIAQYQNKTRIKIIL